MANEIGTASARGREVVQHGEAVDLLSGTAGARVQLPDQALVLRGPSSCPACGAASIAWAYDTSRQTRSEDDFHPLLVDEIDRLAETFCCRDCSAGWIEPNDVEPITWVRPYWLDTT